MLVTYNQVAAVVLHGFMRSRNVTQLYVAERMGTTNSLISRQLSGDLKLTVNIAYGMLSVLHVSFQDYYDELEKFMAYLKRIGAVIGHEDTDFSIHEVRSFHKRYRVGDETIRVCKSAD